MKLEITKPEIHTKAWGAEKWLHNGDGYCGKILCFNKGSKFSLHAHHKVETWYVSKGHLKLIYIDTDNADRHELILTAKDVIHIPSLVPHQLIAIEDSEVFEVSQIHSEDGSLRYEKGDSQTKEDETVEIVLPGELRDNKQKANPLNIKETIANFIGSIISFHSEASHPYLCPKCHKSHGLTGIIKPIESKYCDDCIKGFFPNYSCDCP